jgi:hypothetical protein
MVLKRVVLGLAAMVVLAGPVHAAGVQTHGSEQLGKVWIGVHPLGFSPFFDSHGNVDTIYKFGFDVLGHIADAGRLSLWLGGELNIGGATDYALVEPGIIFQMTFEKLISIPLVPHVRVGLSGGIDNYLNRGVCYDQNGVPFNCPGGNTTAGDFWFKFGGGVHYFIIRQIGLGIDTDFGLGGYFYKDAANRTHSAFRGYVDFLAGAVFTF